MEGGYSRTVSRTHKLIGSRPPCAEMIVCACCDVDKPFTGLIVSVSPLLSSQSRGNSPTILIRKLLMHNMSQWLSLPKKPPLNPSVGPVGNRAKGNTVIYLFFKLREPHWCLALEHPTSTLLGTQVTSEKPAQGLVFKTESSSMRLGVDFARPWAIRQWMVSVPTGALCHSLFVCGFL